MLTAEGGTGRGDSPASFATERKDQRDSAPLGGGATSRGGQGQAQGRDGDACEKGPGAVRYYPSPFRRPSQLTVFLFQRLQRQSSGRRLQQYDERYAERYAFAQDGPWLGYDGGAVEGGFERGQDGFAVCSFPLSLRTLIVLCDADLSNLFLSESHEVWLERNEESKISVVKGLSLELDRRAFSSSPLPISH